MRPLPPPSILAAALSLCAIAPPARAADVLVATGSAWRFLDDGSDQGSGWTAPAFDDSLWSAGSAELGYGDGDEATVVGFGPDPANKYVTTYFRHAFSVADASLYASLLLRLRRDDGAIAYLNGSEIYRSNLPGGPTDFRTLALTTVAGADEDTFVLATLDAAALVTGANLLAVEVHQDRADSSDISLELELSGSAASLDEPEFVWAGALTPTSIRVNARMSIDSSTVRLLVSEQPDLTGARVSGLHAADLASNNRVVSITLRGLTPGTSYYYAIESNGTLGLGKRGRFRTPTASPMSFTFGLGSCAATGSDHAVYDTIRLHDPLFFLHLGDLHYSNIAINDVSLYRAAFDNFLQTPRPAELLRNQPIAYVWDDHDFGPNNGDSTNPSRPAARATYQEYVPHYPLQAGSGDVPIYQTFAIGRVFFVVADARSERSPDADPDGPAKTMLGPLQKPWFKQQLLDVNGVYPVIVWINTLPWIGPDLSDTDAWFNYPSERRELADFIKDNAIQGLVMVSGDAHMLAIDDGSGNNYATGGSGPNFPVFHAAALDRPGSIKGGPYSHGAFPGPGQFGLMTVEDDGVNPICITWSGRDASDAEIVGYRFCFPAAPGDHDGDGRADVLDCAFADPSAWARPRAVDRLFLVKDRTSGGVAFSWTSQDVLAGPGTSYDLVNGRLPELKLDADFRRAGCFVGAQTDSPLLDPSAMPPAGAPEYFLVRAVNACGSGGYGHTSTADPRFPLDGDTPCPLP